MGFFLWPDFIFGYRESLKKFSPMLKNIMHIRNVLCKSKGWSCSAALEQMQQSLFNLNSKELLGLA